ncbi:MAG: AzlD domain-containing protein [Geodermatophilaceae bacterium]|nr:AzlD domain-containing protein [Geodermatophilaceae bacterium]
MSTFKPWLVVSGAALGTYVLKLVGLSVPPAVLERPLIARTVALIPAALLAALVAVNTFTGEGALVVDFRLAALAAAALTLALRAPFIAVLLVAGGVGALGYVVAG